MNDNTILNNYSDLSVDGFTVVRGTQPRNGKASKKASSLMVPRAAENPSNSYSAPLLAFHASRPMQPA